MIRRNLLLGVSLAAIACGEQKTYAPGIDQYQCANAKLLIPGRNEFPSGHREQFRLPKQRAFELYIRDTHCDGKAKELYDRGRIVFIRRPEGGPLGPVALDNFRSEIFMTPELQEVTDRMLHDNARAAYLVDSLMIDQEERKAAQDSVRRIQKKMEAHKKETK